MFSVLITEKGGAQRRMDFDKAEVTIGRVQGNDIILPKGNVSKRHSRIVLKDARFIVVDLKSTNGTYVNGRKITSPLVVKPGDKIYIGDFIMTVEGGADGAASAGPPPPPPPSGPSGPPPLPGREDPPSERFALDKEPSQDHAQPPAAPAPAAPEPAAPPAAPGPAAATGPAPVAALQEVMIRVAQSFDVASTDAQAMRDQRRWKDAESAVQTAVKQLASEGKLGDADQAALTGAAVREAAGLGIVDGLLQDPNVREIVVEGPLQVVADYGKGLVPVAGGFSSSEGLHIVARRLMSLAGARLEPGQAIHEGTLPHGPHVTIVLPPVATRGPIIEIRRVGRPVLIDALIERGTLNKAMVEMLRDAVSARRNVLVAGAVGAGVSTVLGALAGLSDPKERIVSVEDVADLAIPLPHVVSLAAGQGVGGLDLPGVLRQASRLRADRLVVDDVRGGEAFEALSAVGARPTGNFVGVHVGPGHRALDAMMSLLKLGSRADDDALSQLIARAVHVIVEVEADEDGARHVIRISEVTGATGGSVQAQELFVYDGDFNSTGNAPSFRG